MAQDRLTEGGRSLVWRAVADSLNAHRRTGALARGLFLKFESWEASSGSWEPGMPDEPAISEEAIQNLIADIAADVCKRVEAALDRIDPREPPKPPSAADRARSRWVARPSPDPGVLKDGELPDTGQTYERIDPQLDDPELVEISQKAVEALEAEGHTPHCARRMIWGDGNCECGRDQDWQVWKKRAGLGAASEKDGGWMTRPEYIFASRELAERKAEGFKRQLSVVDICVLPVGQRPFQALDEREQIDELKEALTSGQDVVRQLRPVRDGAEPGPGRDGDQDDDPPTDGAGGGERGEPGGPPGQSGPDDRDEPGRLREE